MDIIISVNGQQGDTRDIKYFQDFEEGQTHTFFRGNNQASISQGDHVILQHKGKLWGFLRFEGYDVFDGSNLEGKMVRHSNAILAKGPFVKFDEPVQLMRDETMNYGFRYVDPTKYCGRTVSALRRQFERSGEKLHYIP